MDQEGPLFHLEMKKAKIPEESEGPPSTTGFQWKKLGQHALTLKGHTPKVGLHYSHMYAEDSERTRLPAHL